MRGDMIRWDKMRQYKISYNVIQDETKPEKWDNATQDWRDIKVKIVYYWENLGQDIEPDQRYIHKKVQYTKVINQINRST